MRERNNGPGDQSKAAETKPERLFLVGRIASPVSFHTTGQRKLVARFRLAVADEGETTQWHTVKAYGARAETLEEQVGRGELGQGIEVELIGYLHRRQRRASGERVKLVAEIYVDTLTRSKR